MKPKKPENTVLVLGAGVIGITTAYMLAKKGYKVSVIDKASAPARVCSFANAGQLSYSHAEPWANWTSVKLALKWLGRKDAPLRLHFRFDMAMYKWMAQFLWQARTSRVKENTKATLELGLYSREIMHQLVDELDLDFAYQKHGILHLFHDNKSFNHAARHAQFQKQYGAEYQLLDANDCMKIEPSLSNIDDNLVGGIHDILDEQGDIFHFSEQLEKICREQFNVEFHYDTEIIELQEHRDKISDVMTTQGNFSADNIVVALGVESTRILKHIGIKAAIYPLKGYSISIPYQNRDDILWPKMSVTDELEKIVMTPLKDRLRIAGTVEFAGYDSSIDTHRINMLKNWAKKFLPQIPEDLLDQSNQWACLRPQTPWSSPIISNTKFSNLWLNTGHGTLGWTQAAGSAAMLCKLMGE